MKPSKTPRRKQEDRSAATRARLLEAAIASLHSRGYAATTTMVVCEESGVSRGAMLHQFPSKVDLMLYVVRAVYEQDIAFYREALEPISNPGERLSAFLQVAWQALRRPEGVAVLEIMQGSRSDAELSARLKPLQQEIEQDSFRQSAALLGNIGPQASAAATRLFVWALRGLSVARVLTDDVKEIDRSVDLLARILTVAVEKDVLKVGASRTRARKKSQEK